MRYLGIIIEYENESVKQEFQFLAMGVSEKAQWMADITQVMTINRQTEGLPSIMDRQRAFCPQTKSLLPSDKGPSPLTLFCFSS